MLESTVEKAIKRYAAKHKDELIYWKFQVPGMRGVPDRIAINRKGTIIFIELKRPGQKPRKLQEWIIHKMQGYGLTVYAVDNASDGIRILEELIDE